ncbi:hypothetical protein E8E13_008163 [Curvularia kusanoi]|uniref:Retrovirus-related Pol polyprotein from transposon TNT 1-94-like beta-barrel domain-containing protein n=1 Tax=Curvularia kusanoi TaxID=90978 RepID=A0A9P4TJY4_CURKU|nr:hypothetical protein E8E13_008163 [Curvularia kusanoi]
MGYLCPDWIYSDSSGVHVAKDKEWFTSYHPFLSELSSTYPVGGRRFPVLGIGTIQLTVKATPGSFTVYGISKIELHNVLHVPSYSHNVLGRPLASTYQIQLGREGAPVSQGGLVLDGIQIAYFQRGPLSYLSLAVLPPEGLHFGPSAVARGAAWVASCHWPNEERVRWHSYQAQAKLEHAPPQYEDPYTAFELGFVAAHWESEFRFLMQHGLHIGEEKDRSKGRRILRALIKGKDL